MQDDRLVGQDMKGIIQHSVRFLEPCRSLKSRGKRNEQAVSEAIGFIIIFGIIIAGIGLVTLYGYPMLLQQQTNADEQIMEKNLIVLQNDVKSLAYKTVPYKETSLKVGSGSLFVYNMTNTPTSAFMIYSENGDPGTCITKDDGSTCYSVSDPLKFNPGDLRYESTSAQTGMSLENGAVVKRMLAENGSTMLAAPRWFYDSTSRTGVIYLIGFNTTDVMSRAGVGTVKMELDQTKTNSTPYTTTGNQVCVKYDPNTNADYSTAWNNYFQNTLGTNSGSSGCSSGYYPFPAAMEKLVITKYEIVVKSV